MNVRHFNTLLHGGAATAARRLHESLLREGVESQFLYSGTESPVDELGESYEPVQWKKHSVYQKIRSAIDYRLHRQTFKKSLDRRGAGHEIFTSPRGRPRSVLGTPKTDTEILHLHWIARMIDYQSFFGSIDEEQPIVWTLHDMNAMTGGCHFSDGCQNFVSGCGLCHQLRQPAEQDLSRAAFLEKRMAMLGKNLHIVAPSRWLLDSARRSSMFEPSVTFHHIPYGIDTEAYYPMDPLEARARLGLPRDHRIVCFGAADVKAIRKGGRELLAALHAIADLPKVICLVFGAGQLPESRLATPPIHAVGSITGTLEQRTVMSAADLFILPSLEDNLPLTGLEAMACGTPIVGFEAGGIPDYVRHGTSGWLANVGDAADLAAKLRIALEDADSLTRLRRSTRQMVEREYSQSREARYYQSLYATLVNRSSAGVARVA